MKRLIDIGKNLKQILNDSNIALINKGLETVKTLSDLANKLNKLEINRLPYLMKNEIIELNEKDFGDGEIKKYAFFDCNSLEVATIPDSVTTIGDSAFYDCNNLTSIIIPESVTTIGRNAFHSCNNLTDIYLQPTTPPTLGNTNTIPTTTIIHVPVGSGEAYKNATNWSYHSTKIVEDIVVL